jgi:outer membrane protein assembly factor BamD (BamD/ComL family)
MNKKLLVLVLSCFFVFFSCSAEKKDWKNAESENTIEAYEAYLKTYPQGKFADKANAGIEELTWQSTLEDNSINSYEAYLKQYPQGKYTDKAKAKIEEMYFKAAESENTVSAYEKFLNKYPQGELTDKAKAKIEEFPKLEKLYKETYIVATINNEYGQTNEAYSNNGEPIIKYIWNGAWIDKVYVDFYVKNTRGSGKAEISITQVETKKGIFNLKAGTAYKIRAIINAGETGPWNMTPWSQYQVILNANSFKDIITFEAPSGRMRISEIKLENYPMQKK